ncbi:hypothetical protein GCM10009860_06140 [Microbacterium mitrae]
MGAKDNVRARRNLVYLLDKDGTHLLQLGDDVNVVHDLFAHVNRRAVTLQSLLHRDHGTVNTGAVSAGGGEQNLLGPINRDILESLTTPRDTGNRQAHGRGTHPLILSANN